MNGLVRLVVANSAWGGGDIYVNPDHVALVFQDVGGDVEVYTVTNQRFVVRGTLESVAHVLGMELRP